MTETLREIREKLIIQWYEKKLNRDELLRVLEWSGLDDGSKKKYKSEIMQNFYENFEEAKNTEEFKSADAKYREIKKLWRTFEEKSLEIIKKKVKSESELKKIDAEILGIAAKSMDLGDGSWWKGRRLWKAEERWDELEAQQKEIKLEIWELEKEKVKLEASLKIKREEYWPEFTRTIRKPKKNAYIPNSGETIKGETLKWYKEKYYKILEDKKNYMKNVLLETKNLDFWIDEEKKKNILEEVEANLRQEIDAMEWWDQYTKSADDAEKWLKDNRKVTMERLSDLQQKIWELEKEIEELENKKDWLEIEEAYKIVQEECGLRIELAREKDEFDTISKELGDRIKIYDGTHMDWSKKIRVESWEEKCDRERRFWMY